MNCLGTLRSLAGHSVHCKLLGLYFSVFEGAQVVQGIDSPKQCQAETTWQRVLQFLATSIATKTAAYVPAKLLRPVPETFPHPTRSSHTAAGL